MAGFLEMSDEDFANQSPPVVAAETPSETPPPEGGAGGSETTTQPETQVEETVTPAATETQQNVEQPADEELGEPPVVTKTEEVPNPENKDEPSAPGSKTEEKPVEPKDGNAPAVTTTPEQPVVVDYKAAYEQILTPFKANGKMIQVKNLDEAKQLMQMGANFTKKMQELQPHRKMLMMLDNNGLLDEGKLSFLIDLEKKNPEAIKKLIKESGINPMDIDVETEPAYQAGNHRVTDEEASFKTVLDDLGSNPEGKETLQVINREWDQASKEALWKEPGVMTIIHEQREIGIYTVIRDEVDRLRTLGTIPNDVPFIQAYKVVGDNLAKAGKFDHLVQGKGTSKESGQPAASTPAAPVPVAQRVVAPKPVVANNAQAQAASQQRSAPRKAAVFVNPLAMSDDEFLKQMKNRV